MKNKKYRIIKRTTTETNRVYYYIEEKKFLFWEYWKGIKKLLNYNECNAELKTFHTIEQAKEYLKILKDEILEEVIDV
jgi:hypothetical protein